jgi:uncharacterized protein YcbK (DUF882 family)
MYEAKYFTIGEFDSPDLPNSGINMDNEFLKLLDKARDTAGIPFKITSGYRTESHNSKVGGVANSSHLRGYAADIACTSGTDRWTIIDSLIKAGFNRIGVAKTFIHVDNDPDKSSAIWTY